MLQHMTVIRSVLYRLHSRLLCLVKLGIVANDFLYLVEVSVVDENQFIVNIMNSHVKFNGYP